MFSEDGEVDAARIDTHVTEVDAFVSAASKTTRFGLRMALLLVRLAPILFFLRFTTIERLALGDRVKLLERLECSSRSTLSLAFIGWRTVMTLVFYEDASELRAIGYEGHDRQRWKRALPFLAPAPMALESGVRLRDVPSIGQLAQSGEHSWSDETPIPQRAIGSSHDEANLANGSPAERGVLEGQSPSKRRPVFGAERGVCLLYTSRCV